MADNPTLYQITLPSGTTYDLKDAKARADIADIKNTIAGGVNFLGYTTTALADGDTTATIVINGNNHTAAKGDLVAKGDKEFLFDGSKWIEVGDLNAFKALAYKDSASGSYTPSGTITAPEFSGSEMTVSGTFTPSGNVTIGIGESAANYTPAGTITQPTFSGSEMTATASYTPEGTVTLSIGNGEANYTPSGTIINTGITLTPSTSDIVGLTSVGTLPSLTMTVVSENLTITFSAGTLPSAADSLSVMTGATAAFTSTPGFSGTGVDLTAAFAGTSATISATGTPEGTVTQPTFNGTGVELVASFSGTSATISATGTPEGSITAPEFSGTSATISVS